MTRVRFHEAAFSELEHEVEYYGAIDSRLGERFALAVERVIALAAEFPNMGSPFKYGTRRVFPKRFPFSVVDLHRGDEVFILALAPDDKKPGYWRSRVLEG